MARNVTTIKKNAGRGCSPASGIVTTTTTTSTFSPNFAPTWRDLQRAHAARASALCVRGVELRRVLRARARS